MLRFHLEIPCVQGDEVVMSGWEGTDRVVARMSTLDLESHFGRPWMLMDEVRRIASVNLECLERAVTRKCSRGEFHSDLFRGGPVKCIHLQIGDIVRQGDPFFDAELPQKAGP